MGTSVHGHISAYQRMTIPITTGKVKGLSLLCAQATGAEAELNIKYASLSVLAFPYACEDLGIFFFEVGISSRTLIPLFMPESVHSGTAS